MKHTKNTIPTHDFAPDDDLNAARIRYIPMDVRNDTDFSPPHRHNYYVLLFFKKGGGTHIIDFVQYPIADYSVHLVKPGQVHVVTREPDSYGAAVHFSKDAAVHFPAVCGLLQTVYYPLRNHDAAGFAPISSILTLLQAEVSGSDTEVAATCLAMLLLKAIGANDPQAKKQDTGTRQQFTSFEELVERNYREGYTPAWYAQQLVVTEKKLNAICKDATGTTVGHYLKERILLEAKRLLSHSGGSIKEIGYYLGFDDPAYFARFFCHKCRHHRRSIQETA